MFVFVEVNQFILKNLKILSKKTYLGLCRQYIELDGYIINCT